MIIKINRFHRILHILLLFCFIFKFKIPVLSDNIPFINSTYIASFFAIFLVVYNKKLHVVWKLLSMPYVLNIICFNFVFLFFGLFSIVIHGTYELVIFKSLISLVIYLILFIPIIALVCDNDNFYIDDNYVYKIFIAIFVIQVIIQISALSSGEFRDVLRLFQHPDAVKLAPNYRGLTLSGELFFSIGASFGFMVLLLSMYMAKMKEYSFKTGLIYISFIIGITLSARTGYIGVILSLLYFIFVNEKMRRIILFLLKVLISVAILLSIFFSLLSSEQKEVINDQLIPWAFEMFINLGEKGEVSTKSGNVLVNMWDTHIDDLTFFIGEGRYGNPDGTYYKHVDIGYLRNIFFFGIPWILLRFIYQLLFLIKPYFFIKDKYSKRFILTVLIYMLVLHAKGEALGQLKILSLMLFFYYSTILYKSKLVRESIVNNV